MSSPAGSNGSPENGPATATHEENAGSLYTVSASRWPVMATTPCWDSAATGHFERK